MSSSTNAQNITIEQYASQIKSTVFTMTGALGSRMEKITDELLQQVVNLQNQSKAQVDAIKKDGDEILRLKDLLSQNKITYEIPSNGKVKIPQRNGK